MLFFSHTFLSFVSHFLLSLYFHPLFLIPHTLFFRSLSLYHSLHTRTPFLFHVYIWMPFSSLVRVWRIAYPVERVNLFPPTLSSRVSSTPRNEKKKTKKRLKLFGWTKKVFARKKFSQIKTLRRRKKIVVLYFKRFS